MWVRLKQLKKNLASYDFKNTCNQFTFINESPWILQYKIVRFEVQKGQTVFWVYLGQRSNYSKTIFTFQLFISKFVALYYQWSRPYMNTNCWYLWKPAFYFSCQANENIQWASRADIPTIEIKKTKKKKKLFLLGSTSKTPPLIKMHNTMTKA